MNGNIPAALCVAWIRFEGKFGVENHPLMFVSCINWEHAIEYIIVIS